MEKGQSEKYAKQRWPASNSAGLSSPSPVRKRFISSALLCPLCRPASSKYLWNSWKPPRMWLCLFYLSPLAQKQGSSLAKLLSIIYFPTQPPLCVCVFVYLGREQESAATALSKTLLTSPAASAAAAAAAGISSRSSSSSSPCPGQING